MCLKGCFASPDVKVLSLQPGYDRLRERLAPSVLTSADSGHYTFYRLRPSAEQILNKAVVS